MRWLCWISRTSLLAAGLIPLVYFFYFHIFDLKWEPTDWDWSINLLVILGLLLASQIFTWKYPIAGGILSLCAVFLWLIWEYAFILFATPTRYDYYSYFRRSLILEEWFLLLLGGILSIIWGKKRKGLQQAKLE